MSQNLGEEPYSTTRMLDSQVGQVNLNGGSFPPGTASLASHDGQEIRRLVSIRHSLGPRAYVFSSSFSSESSSSSSADVRVDGLLYLMNNNASANKT